VDAAGVRLHAELAGRELYVLQLGRGGRHGQGKFQGSIDRGGLRYGAACHHAACPWNATVLFGDSNVNGAWRSGGRLHAGYWFDPSRKQGIEVSFFDLQDASTVFDFC
jgi:Putative beta barrel porin-7 (BBP7)